MANSKTIQVSFAGGEISPSMYGRKDDVKYQNGLKRCLNFLVHPQGPVSNRPGFEFVEEAGNSSKQVRLIPFVYSTEQTMVIELGDYYARFHSLGGTLVNDDGSIYQISTPWAAEDLFDLDFTQSGDIVTVVHQAYSPREIRRYGARDWRIVEINFNATLATPTGVTASIASSAEDDPNKDKYTVKYRVSCLNSDKTEESAASGIVSIVANLYAYGTTVKISCNAVSGASFYRFYKCIGGLYGYIGDSEEPEIIDDNITPKTDITVRRFDNPFVSGNYPGAVGYFEQRRCFAGLASDPQRIVMTRTATESQLSYSLPNRDDDRISFRIASREFNRIMHIVPMAQLMLLTSGNEFRVSPLNTDAITPSSVSVRPQSNVGSTKVMPQTVGNMCLYVAARGGHVREMGYQYQAGGYTSTDICLRSSHFFDFKDLKDSAVSKAPLPIVWYVSSDGSLLGLTYIPEQEVCAWHQHVTDGIFESVCAVSEGDEDHLYVVVRRTVNGVQKRYIERMWNVSLEGIGDSFFVDAGGVYEGPPATVISNLDWLEGKTVSILADGAVMPQQKVTGGKIKLDHAASRVVVGIPYNSDLQTLPVSISDSPALGAGRFKNVYKTFLRVNKSSGVMAGPEWDRLVEFKQRTTEQPGFPPELTTGEIEIQLRSQWDDSGELCIRQADPLPLTIQSIVLNVGN